MANRVRGLEIDGQFEIRCLLDRHLGRVGAAQSLDHLARHLTEDAEQPIAFSLVVDALWHRG